MKKNLTLLLLLVSVLAFGQRGQRRQYSPKNNSFGIINNRIAVDSVLHIPRKYSNITNEVYNGVEQDSTPQIYVKDTSLWYYAGGVHRVVSGATGGGGGTYIPPTVETDTSTGSTVITFQHSYQSGTIQFYEAGNLRYLGTDYNETSPTTITLTYTPFIGVRFTKSYQRL